MSEQFQHVLGIISILAFMAWLLVYVTPFGEMVGRGQAIKAYANMEFECQVKLVRKEQ